MATVKRRREKAGTDATGAPVYKEVDGWQVRWIDPKGKQRSKQFVLKSPAEKFAREVEQGKDEGSYIDPKSQQITVKELGDRLFATKKVKRNRDFYVSRLKYVNAAFGDTKVLNLEFDEIQVWVNQQTADGHGPTVVRANFRVFHEIVKLALRGRRLKWDPCDGIELPKVRRRDMVFLNPAQINLLADAMDETHPNRGYGTLVRFTAYSGARAGEVGGVMVRDLNLLRHTLHIQRALQPNAEYSNVKGGGMGRWVDLPHQLCDELAAHIKKFRLKLTDPLFPGELGGPLNHNSFYARKFKPVVDSLSDRGLLPIVQVTKDGETTTFNCRFHDLRHTCVALLISQGAQQYEVMEHLGHEKIQTTIDIYGHLFHDVRERIRTHLENVWASAA